MKYQEFECPGNIQNKGYVFLDQHPQEMGISYYRFSKGKYGDDVVNALLFSEPFIKKTSEASMTNLCIKPLEFAA